MMRCIDEMANFWLKLFNGIWIWKGSRRVALKFPWVVLVLLLYAWLLPEVLYYYFPYGFQYCKEILLFSLFLVIIRRQELILESIEPKEPRNDSGTQ